MVDVIITLGHKLNRTGGMTDILRSRVEKAVKLFFRLNKKNPRSVYLVFSGGISKSHECIDIPTESHVMSEMALENGVPNEFIIQENGSKTTLENALNTYNIIVLSPFRIRNCYLVTSDFHMNRASRIFRHSIPYEIRLKEDSTEDILTDFERKELKRHEMYFLENEWPFSL